MNGYVMAALAALVFSYAVTALARGLNVRSLQNALPAEFSGVYDATDYANSQAYVRAGAGLAAIEETAGLLLTAGFIVCGGFGWLDGWTRSLGYSELSTGLIFIGSLTLVQAVFGLPFEVWNTFVLEARFGFNTTTVKVFITDRLKGMALGLVLGGVLLTAVLVLFQQLGDWAWLAAWGTVTLFTVVMLLVAPVWILPLFNTFKPLEPGPLRQAIEAYATGQGFSLSGIFVMDGSKRSTKANAFFTGFGKRKRISLYDTLINRLTTEELVAVLAHEVGHSKHHHLVKGLLLAVAKMGALLFVLQLFLSGGEFQRGFGVSVPSVHAGLMLFGLVYQPVALALSVLANAFSRRWEYQADAFAAAGQGGPQAMVDALKALSVANLSNLTPHPLMVWLNYSHPPVLARIRAITGQA